MTITDQPCEACGAIAGEECNPLCLGDAAHWDRHKCVAEQLRKASDGSSYCAECGADVLDAELVDKVNDAMAYMAQVPACTEGLTIVNAGDDGFLRMYSQNAWTRPDVAPMLPWSAPTGIKLVNVDYDGTVTVLP